MHANEAETGIDFKHTLRHAITMVLGFAIYRDLLRSDVDVNTGADIHRTEDKEQFRTKETSSMS